MSKLNMIRIFLRERLTMAALEIFEVVEVMFAECQDEISRSKEENARLQRLLDVVSQPNITLHRTDMQQFSLPEPPQIKEEQELWTSQEEEQLQGLQSETTNSIFTSLCVKHDSVQESSSERSHINQTFKVEDREGDFLPTNTTEEQIKAEPQVQDYAAPEPGSDSQPVSVVAPDCPAAQSLEEEHGGVLLLQNRTQNNEALPGDNRPQGSHRVKTRHQCQQCNKTFSLKSSLVRHMRMHTRDIPYQYQHGSKQFAHKLCLVDHVKTHTGEKSYQCQECRKRFSLKSQLVVHMRTHTGEKPFQCQECNKRFSMKCTLVRHMRMHTGKKPNQCQQCSQQFASNFCLVDHMRIHTGEKPLHCQECFKIFNFKSHLIMHMRTHTGEKPYQCQECNKRFSVKCTLVRHMKTHTGEKPYQCQECKKCFSQKSSLVTHMMTHRM
ncbi:zinc finger protein 391-like [Hypomesus transpacificus]|uniref:zinc finger protein 391-like n=1 Tax=Hypomesus transpacificus TaxID=137520 RepID=UPI001F07A95A|nr:zinc finger protein 391-like [Hypomesus transpacificus]